MPRGPGIIDRVNYVVNSWNNPCKAPWAVYMETALPAALDALVAVICFDVLDVVRWIFRPTGLRSGRHGRRGKKGQHGRKPKGFAAKLASKLPPFAKLRQRKISQGVKTLWVIDGIGQRLLWWWLVIDVTTGFLYNWTSMIYKTERCQMANAPGAALRTANPGSVLAIQNWQAAGYAISEYDEGTVSTGPFGFSVGVGVYTVVAGFNCFNQRPVPISAELRLRIQTPGGEEIFLGGAAPMGIGGSADVIAVAGLKGPFNGIVEMRVDTHSVNWSAGTLYVQGKPPVQDPPVKFTCKSPFFPQP